MTKSWITILLGRCALKHDRRTASSIHDTQGAKQTTSAPALTRTEQQTGAESLHRFGVHQPCLESFPSRHWVPAGSALHQIGVHQPCLERFQSTHSVPPGSSCHAPPESAQAARAPGRRRAQRARPARAPPDSARCCAPRPGNAATPLPARPAPRRRALHVREAASGLS